MSGDAAGSAAALDSGALLEANTAACELLGFETSELVGLEFESLVAEPHRDASGPLEENAMKLTASDAHGWFTHAGYATAN